MRLILRLALGLGVLGLLAIIFLPTVLFSTPVKNWILQDVLREQGIAADIEKVTVGWLSPTKIKQVSIGPVEKRRLLQAEEISVNRTLLQAIFSGADLGELTIRRPQVHIWIDDSTSNLKFEQLEENLENLQIDLESDSDDETTNPTETSNPEADDDSRKFAINVQDAELYVKTPAMTEETNVITDLDIRCTILKEPARRTLLVDPGPIIKRASITPELCEAGLKFVLPVLANATWTKGEFSLDLDACIVDLDEPTRSLISGRLTIHGIEAGIRNQLADGIADELAKFMGRDGFDAVHLADDSVVQFQVVDGMVWHEGVEVGLPRVSQDLVVKTSGSVSFDEQLDLTIDCPMPLHLVAKGPLSRALRDQSLSLRATGPVQKPNVKLDDDFLPDLISSIGGELAEEERPLQSLLQGFRDVVRPNAARPADGKENANETSTGHRYPSGNVS